ncbi:MAG: hypothetical protein ACPGUV_01265 [Polyangiales bacterium]
MLALPLPMFSSKERAGNEGVLYPLASRGWNAGAAHRYDSHVRQAVDSAHPSRRHGRRMGLAWAVLTWLTLGGIACDTPSTQRRSRPGTSRHAPDKRAQPPKPTRPALRGATQASPWPPGVPPWSEGRSVQESLAACQKRLKAALPLEVAQTFADLGYSDALRDSCLSKRAVQRGDPQACAKLGVRALRQGCLERLAVVHGQPEHCPHDRLWPGGKALCLAWALRRPAYCDRLASDAAQLCRAVFTTRPEACADSPRPGHCRAMQQRYADLLMPAQNTEPLPAVQQGLSVLRRAPGGQGWQGLTPVQVPQLEGGVYLRVRDCQWQLVFGRRRPALLAGTAHRDVLHLALEVTLPPEATERRQRLQPPAVRATLQPAAEAQGQSVAPVVEGASASDAGAALPAAWPHARTASRGSVIVQPLSKGHGGPLRLELDLYLQHGDQSEWLRGHLHTFIRDRQRMPSRCAGAGQAPRRRHKRHSNQATTPM